MGRYSESSQYSLPSLSSHLGRGASRGDARRARRLAGALPGRNRVPRSSSIRSTVFSPTVYQALGARRTSACTVWESPTGHLLVGLSGHTCPRSIAPAPVSARITSGESRFRDTLGRRIAVTRKGWSGAIRSGVCHSTSVMGCFGPKKGNWKSDCCPHGWQGCWPRLLAAGQVLSSRSTSSQLGRFRSVDLHDVSDTIGVALPSGRFAHPSSSKPAAPGASLCTWTAITLRPGLKYAVMSYVSSVYQLPSAPTRWPLTKSVYALSAVTATPASMGFCGNEIVLRSHRSRLSPAPSPQIQCAVHAGLSRGWCSTCGLNSGGFVNWGT